MNSPGVMNNTSRTPIMLLLWQDKGKAPLTQQWDIVAYTTQENDGKISKHSAKKWKRYSPYGAVKAT